MGFLDLLAVTGSDLAVTEPGSGDAAATFAALGMVLGVSLVLYLIVSFLLYRIFEKAGRPGWAGFVPVYNMWVYFEIAGKPGWWALLIFPMLIPFIGFLVSIAWLVLTLIASLEFAKRFGKGPVFGVLALWLFSIVGYAILAFDSSKYQAAGVPTGSPTDNDPNKTPEVFANNNPSATPPSENPPTKLVQ